VPVYKNAVDTGDITALQPYLDPNVTGVGATNEEVVGVEGIKAYWEKIRDLIGHDGKYTVDAQFEPNLLDGDIAISRGTSTNTIVVSGGTAYRYTTRWTVVSRKSAGTWKVVRIHDSMDPIYNEFVRTFAKQAITRTAMIAAGRRASHRGVTRAPPPPTPPPPNIGDALNYALGFGADSWRFEEAKE
jgi:ketosteroid isomerase-like protein